MLTGFSSISCLQGNSGLPHHFKRAHHLVRGMLKQMAVPDVFTRIALETDNDASHGFGIRLHCILPAALSWRRWGRGSAIVKLP